jgi:ribonuclease VapC
VLRKRPVSNDANESTVYILDSFALLAFLEDERGAVRVQEILESAWSGDTHAYLSLINMGEVLYITERERGLPLAQKTLSAIEQLPLGIVSASRERVLAAAHIKANYTLAYADAFAVAAALEFQGPVVTGDPEFSAVETLVQVEWL